MPHHPTAAARPGRPPQVERFLTASRRASRRPGYPLRLARAMSLLGYEIGSPSKVMAVAVPGVDHGGTPDHHGGSR